MFRGDLLRKTERQLCAQGLHRSVFDHTENGGKQDGKEKDKGGSADSELEVGAALNVRPSP